MITRAKLKQPRPSVRELEPKVPTTIGLVARHDQKTGEHSFGRLFRVSYLPLFVNVRMIDDEILKLTTHDLGNPGLKNRQNAVRHNEIDPLINDFIFDEAAYEREVSPDLRRDHFITAGDYYDVGNADFSRVTNLAYVWFNHLRIEFPSPSTPIVVATQLQPDTHSFVVEE